MGEHVAADLVAGDITVGEFSLVKDGPYICYSVVWGQLTHGAQSSAPLWCIRRVHLAFRVSLFLNYFHRFEYKL